MPPQTKRCPKCGETKENSEFNKNKKSSDGLDARCRSCRKEYYQEKRSSILESKKKYHVNNRRKRNFKARLHYQENKEQYYTRWVLRESKKLNAIPEFLANCQVEKERLRQIYKLREVISKATGIEYHVDHMWPLADGGPHWSGNLQLLTATENRSKSAAVCSTLKRNIKASLKVARKEYEDRSNGHRDGRAGRNKDLGDLREGREHQGD